MHLKLKWNVLNEWKQTKGASEFRCSNESKSYRKSQRQNLIESIARERVSEGKNVVPILLPEPAKNDKNAINEHSSNIWFSANAARASAAFLTFHSRGAG